MATPLHGPCGCAMTATECRHGWKRLDGARAVKPTAGLVYPAPDTTAGLRPDAGDAIAIAIGRMGT